MYELTVLMLRLCNLLRRVTWKDPGDEHELACITERIIELAEEMWVENRKRD